MFDELDAVIEGSDTSQDDLKGGGGMVEKAGYYHVRVQDVVPYSEEGKLPNRRVDLHVLAGTEPSEVGKILFHRIYLMTWERDANKVKTGKMAPPSKGARMMAFRFFLGMGLVNKEELGQKDIHLPFSKLPNCQAIVKVVREDKDSDGKPLDKPNFKVAETYTLDDPKVADVPMDAEYLTMWESEMAANRSVIDDIAVSFGDV